MEQNHQHSDFDLPEGISNGPLPSRGSDWGNCHPATSVGDHVPGKYSSCFQCGVLTLPTTRDVERCGHNEPNPCWMPSNFGLGNRAMVNRAASADASSDVVTDARTWEDSTPEVRDELVRSLQTHLGRAQPELEDRTKDLLVRAHHLEDAGIKRGLKKDRRRRKTMREFYSTLHSLLPTFISTKTDQVSIVDDTIRYIHVLEDQIEELKLAVANKRLQRRKLESDREKPNRVVETMEKSKDGERLNFEQKLQDFLKSEGQDLQLVSKHGAVAQFHVVTNQLQVNIVQNRTRRFLLRLLEALAGITIKQASFNVVNDSNVFSITLRLEGKNLRKDAVNAMTKIFNVVEQLAT